MSDGLVARMVESLKARRDRALSRCAKACFCDDTTGELTLEGQTLLADLRNQSKLFGTSIRRDRTGAIDQAEMLRFEGRREIVLRLINLLELGPMSAAQLVEVDDARI